MRRGGASDQRPGQRGGSGREKARRRAPNITGYLAKWESESGRPREPQARRRRPCGEMIRDVASQAPSQVRGTAPPRPASRRSGGEQQHRRPK
eukprot:5051576-Pyramimonas_sp.AAC.1